MRLDADQPLLDAVERLYGAGVSKVEIESGRYSQARILAAGIDMWRGCEQAIWPVRGTLRLQLALFLAQREEGEHGPPGDC